MAPGREAANKQADLFRKVHGVVKAKNKWMKNTMMIWHDALESQEEAPATEELDKIVSQMLPLMSGGGLTRQAALSPSEGAHRPAKAAPNSSADAKGFVSSNLLVMLFAEDGKVKLPGTKALLDTGSTNNVIKLSLLERMCRGIEQVQRIPLYLADGSILECLGVTYLKMALEPRDGFTGCPPKDVEFLVAPDLPCDCIIGEKFINAVNLIQWGPDFRRQTETEGRLWVLHSRGKQTPATPRGTLDD